MDEQRERMWWDMARFCAVIFSLVAIFLIVFHTFFQ
jgi:hypothetical protein